MRIFLGIWLLFWTFLCAEAENTQTKVIYIKALDAQEIGAKSVYVGQVLAVHYSVLLFSQAKFLGAELLHIPNSKQLKRLNFTPVWKAGQDGSLSATYLYKVMGTKAAVPALKVSAFVQDQGYLDTATTPSIPLNVIDLGDHPNYAGVVAQNFKIVGYKTKEYDASHNIVVFEVNAKGANLEDLKIAGGMKQGFESAHFSLDNAQGIYYCIVPKSWRELSFNYFSLESGQFQEVHFAVIPVEETVSTQSNLKPKNNFLLFSNFVLLFFILLALALFFLIPYKKSVLGVAAILVGVLLWNIFFTYRSGVLLANKEIKILPTANSTLLGTSKNALKVEIIGAHGGYYKIMTQDEKIGWVKKSDVE
ncbi:SH3 domain-containing protein [Helicobacter felis]|uniref:SH3 domain-containing protein n=1 Tax=Helicobacter felis TaxID=214 RepID=UPI001F163618|nr:SH3 domain-containing protein [Helicobacter felis]